MATAHDAPPVPLPLEQYAHAFDDLFHPYIQRRRFRDYLAGLLLPRDRNKTLTALVGAEPIMQAQTAPVQQLQFLLSEADWDAEALASRRIAVLQADPLTAPHADGALVIDETGVRKDGTHTAHVGSQYLGTIGKTANGIVAVTSLWATERVYYPLQVRPYTPAARLAGGKHHPAFRTKPQLALELVQAARSAGISFRAVVADSLYGAHPEFKRTMWRADVPYVLAVKPSQLVWTSPPEPESPWEAADRLRWGQGNDAQHPGAWTAVVRRFHDGHEEPWWAVDLRLGSYAPEYPTRLVVATSDPRTLPQASTWYLVTNLPLPGTTRAAAHPALAAADLAEVVRLYGLRQWVEQGYKQVKQELGWADFQVRSDRAIRRHWALVCCAFCFCWWAESQRTPGDAPRERSAALPATTALPLAPEPGAGEKWSTGGTGGSLAVRAHQLLVAAAVLATRAAPGTELA
jgi:SRSO17 transposase